MIPFLFLALASPGQSFLDRLPVEQFDATPPSAVVSGAPGRLRIRRPPACRDLPADRRRIVNLAVQEWAFFGFSVTDRTVETDREIVRSGDWRRWRRVAPAEAARTVSTIAGYWAATPHGAWMVDRQNDRWNRSGGLRSRWRDPWSAAFISWVMCESGLGDRDRFRRAIAHHEYVDQAIRARDDASSPAAFVAHDVGRTAVEPGDLLCSSRRGAYRSIADRRGHAGVEARMHCDIVVKLEPERERIQTIGGNVRGTVGLKLLPARWSGAHLAPAGEMFAHLKLRADPIEDDALERSPTLHALRCDPEAPSLPSALPGLPVDDCPVTGLQ